MKRVFKYIRVFVWLVLIVVGLFMNLPAAAAGQSVQVMHVEGTIVPAVADYIDKGITQAENRGNTIVVIQLSTPGGLLQTTQEIVERILNARVPVVVYVSPAGGWAGSAGTFITLAAHVGAMAPGSRIGAATPVSMDNQQMTEEMKRKVTEDSVAWIRSIAELRNRDPDQAELAVREGKSFPASEAAKYRLIDIQAESLDDLLNQLNGRSVTLASGQVVTLNTQNYGLIDYQMNFFEKFLHTISDPNIAYILLSIGSLGIMAEIYAPGSIFPGTLGAICLLLAFYSLGVLNANWGGILLIVLAFGLFIAELFTASFGALTAGGVISLILGSILLFPRGGTMMPVSPWLIALVVILIVGMVVFVLNRVLKSYKHQPTTGREELKGKMAVARNVLDPEGLVFLKGELWKAVSDKGRIEPGEDVIITQVEGLKLHVTKKI